MCFFYHRTSESHHGIVATPVTIHFRNLIIIEGLLEATDVALFKEKRMDRSRPGLMTNSEPRWS